MLWALAIGAVAAGLEAPAVHRRDPKAAVMRIVALISWIVTALAGATLFGIWVARGGPRRQGAGATRFPPPLIFGHPLLAATGLIVWIIYVATDTDVLRWVAFAILLVVAALGFTMARLWRQEREAWVAAAGADRTVLPPEQHFPVPLIGLHGLLALTTLVLVLLTALGVGD